MTKRSAIDQVEFMRNLLAFLLCGSFVSILAAMFAFKVPAENKEVITYMVGQLSGMALTVLGFYFVNKVGQDALDAKRADNTSKMADAVKSALAGSPSSSAAADAAEQTAEAATDKAREFTGKNDGEPLE